MKTSVKKPKAMEVKDEFRRTEGIYFKRKNVQ